MKRLIATLSATLLAALLFAGQAAAQTQVMGTPSIILPATIASGGTTSTGVLANGKMLVGIDLGPTLTGTTLALWHSVDSLTYRPAYDSTGAAVSWTVAGNRFLTFSPPLCCYMYIEVVSGSAEGGTRTLNFVFAP